MSTRETDPAVIAADRAVRGDFAPKTRAIVYVLSEELNQSENGEIVMILGVYASEAGAEHARRRYVKQAKAKGRRVCGEPCVCGANDDPDEWDVDYPISVHELAD